MSTITYRLVKGSPLTIAEMDANLLNLNNDKAQFSNSTGLRTYISDATGTGKAMFNVSPSINTSLTSETTSFDLLNTVAATINAFGAATALSIGAFTGTTTVNNNIHCLGDVQAESSSDIRLKDDIIPIANALQKLQRIRGVRWKWNDIYKEQHSLDSDTYSPEIGVIAQEVQPEFPELVVERANGYLAVDYSRLIAVLIEAVKELAEEVDSLKLRLMEIK